MSIPLKLYYDPNREDNFSTATIQGEQDALGAGYYPVRVEGYLFPSSEPNVVPLKLYWNSARGDNFTTATGQGEQEALDAGYNFVRVEGYVSPTLKPGLVPLKLYWSQARQDNFTTATAQGEADAQNAGYTPVRTEGYISQSPIGVDIDLKSDLGAGHFMKTTGVLLPSGRVQATTQTTSTTLLGGFRGGVQIFLADANNLTIGVTSSRSFGVDGRLIGRSDRIDFWFEDLDPTVVARTSSLHVAHFWADNPLDALRKFSTLMQTALSGAKPIIDVIAAIKGMGGDAK